MYCIYCIVTYLTSLWWVTIIQEQINYCQASTSLCISIPLKNYHQSWLMVKWQAKHRPHTDENTNQMIKHQTITNLTELQSWTDTLQVLKYAQTFVVCSYFTTSTCINLSQRQILYNWDIHKPLSTGHTILVLRCASLTVCYPHFVIKSRRKLVKQMMGEFPHVMFCLQSIHYSKCWRKFSLNTSTRKKSWKVLNFCFEDVTGSIFSAAESYNWLSYTNGCGQETIFTICFGPIPLSNHNSKELSKFLAICIIVARSYCYMLLWQNNSSTTCILFWRVTRQICK